MFVRNVQQDIAWLEKAIAETQRRIEWNDKNRRFDVIEGEWKDITDQANALLRADIAGCEVMLANNRQKA